MNILVSALPDSVEIEGVAFRLNTDFRACLTTMLAFEDNSLTAYEKQVIMLDNLYIDQPNDLAAALEKAQWFLNGGKEAAPDEKGGSRLFSFAKDASLIFAAFRQTHRINLQKAKMHWWEFLALFMDLGSETTFCQLVDLRKRHRKGKTTKEEKQAIREMGHMFELEEIDDRTLEEREASNKFMEEVRQAKARRDQ